ncbi:hypothetical protein DIU31_010670 [Mucilaginibacter rubeus]|uniref:Uncharacterized protein n=1 Tax=Mucilaginibacter rubeus TaxID=2027860 RepID=A0AAE6JMI7_9SPHI|nr:hypothetical protein DIU31_010670 [Mucilaginibacter rubeus]QEM20692.1 hypothetical protein DIU38_010770 [Mucilaginibacter gossypii]QTE47053.1 hypothetical protein J3L19_16975 [Mucilaginibacter rubeus]QTE53654.1 hypothetical protein J3L21_16950 [Mucilaginibacter rubeus]QTE60155.1 hypothetical protein J3L23_08625 [Mucilaginibacter rubeus]
MIKARAHVKHFIVLNQHVYRL